MNVRMQRRFETARIVTRGGQAYDEVEFSLKDVTRW